MLQSDYDERVYAGVLGKIIGVYLGRPFEGWSNERIEESLGDIEYYVHDKVGVPLIVTDDDISGTFTFVRALSDYHCDPQLTPKQIGQTWLNYLIENRSVLWWGGMGNSTEHTAYLRLTEGHDAPASGSMALNGQVVSEQIGAQIFIDGWAMVCPGDPELAADFARRAGSVSHDGEALHGAQVIAAMESQAFVESDIDKLIDVAVELIPADSLISRMISDIREWHSQWSDDWRSSFQKIKEHYGYDKYGGNCHMVPNHGLIVMALLHGRGHFQDSLKIVNTAGWDTDCNSGNLGCLLGIRNGLAAFDEGVDWRGPVSDICYVPTADSGGGVSDAATEARRIAAMGRKLNGSEEKPPKDGARYHFSLPGSVQGFRGRECVVNNLTTPTGNRALAVHFDALPSGKIAQAVTGTFVESHETARYFEQRGYGLMASPTLNPGQTISSDVLLSKDVEQAIEVALCIQVFDPENRAVTVRDSSISIEPGEIKTLSWQIPSLDGYPIAAAGIEIVTAPAGGILFIDRYDWRGTPDVVLEKRKGGMWHRAWVNGVDSYGPRYPESFRLIQNHGTGLLLYGSRDWNDYQMTADVTPHLVARSGIATRVQGLRRYYALLLKPGTGVQLVRELDGTDVLAETPMTIDNYQTYELEMRVRGNQIEGYVDHQRILSTSNGELTEGGIGLVIDTGRTATQRVRVGPLDQA